MITDSAGLRITYAAAVHFQRSRFMFVLADTFTQAAIARFLLGFIGAGFRIGIRMVSEWFLANELGTAEGIHGGWGNFGSGCRGDGPAHPGAAFRRRRRLTGYAIGLWKDEPAVQRHLVQAA